MPPGSTRRGRVPAIRVPMEILSSLNRRSRPARVILLILTLPLILTRSSHALGQPVLEVNAKDLSDRDLDLGSVPGQCRCPDKLPLDEREAAREQAAPADDRRVVGRRDNLFCDERRINRVALVLQQSTQPELVAMDDEVLVLVVPHI